MLKDELREYMPILGFKRPEQIEKDYLQELVLRNLFAEVPSSGLIFRGGTALSKIFGSGRFSDDLDFVTGVASDTDSILNRVEAGVKAMDALYDASYSFEKYKDMVEYTIKISGPLYISLKNDSARQTLYIDVNTYEKNILGPKSILRLPVYKEIRPYTLIVEQIEELLVDKIRALLYRKKEVARDVYDIWVILTKPYGLEPAKIKEVAEARNMENLDFHAINVKLEGLKKTWGGEIESLTGVKITYEDVKKAVLTGLSKYFVSG